MAALHGYLDPEAMKAAIPQRVYLGWQRYWEHEPWGPWRDNLHAAVISREILRTLVARSGKRQAEIGLDRFFYKSAPERVSDATKSLFTVLGTSAKVVSAKEASRRAKNAKLKRKSRNRKEAK